MKNKKQLGFIIFVLVLFLVACTNSTEEKTQSKEATDKQEKTEGEEREVAGGESDLTIMLGSDPTLLDPHGANDGTSLYVMSTMYDKLVYLNKELEITPGLAESLEQISDTVWEAKIREGVKFHDVQN